MKDELNFLGLLLLPAVIIIVALGLIFIQIKYVFIQIKEGIKKWGK